MRVERIACPHCSLALPPEAIRELTDTPTYNKYRLFLRNLEIQKSPNLKWCPNPKCSVVISTTSKKTSRCPKCETEICNRCNREAHHGRSCAGAFEEEIREWENASDIQKCRKCQGLVEKIAGCNHMTCSICRYEWCWLCGSAYSTAHFSALNPFGCPGLQDRPRDDWGKCKILLLRLALLLLFLVAIPVLLPVAMVACGPALVGNLLWNCIYPDTCAKKMGVVVLSLLVGVAANPVVWVGAMVYLLPKGIKKGAVWVRERREAEERRQNFLQERLLGEEVFEEQGMQ